MFTKIYDRLASLTLGLWLIGGVCLLLAVGSFSGGGAEGSSINDLPLFQWLRETPVAVSWWLWAAIALLALLALNTVLCSIESLRVKSRRGGFLVLIAPQVMHAGFLLIVLAHLFSAWGGYKQIMPLQEGGVITCPDGSRLQLANVTAVMSPMGFPTDYSAELRGREGAATISPNHPFFYKGSGFYLKEVAVEPYRAALIEIHREPGAGAALAGALLFTVGNVVLLYVRRGRQ
ncbi:MAG TPA: cytochrome C biogenesis protein ResB [Geobacteraceae bacterium]|nr:cytochrome C biogenesis protein ResB [Geobacteraceae bacterium]